MIAASPGRLGARRRAGTLPLALALGAVLAACGPSGGPEGSTLTDGSFLLDPNSGGSASDMQLLNIRWGRLVDVYDFDSTAPAGSERSLVYANFLIAESVDSDGVDFELEIEPFTQVTELTIRADFDGDYTLPGETETEAEKFSRLVSEATANLGIVDPTGVDPSASPPFPVVPRNAALMLQFNDLLDHDTINAATVKVTTGTPPVLPYSARILPDPNHGALIETPNGPEFRTTRILIDPAVTSFEAQSSGADVNPIGLPASLRNNTINVAFRIPTRMDAVQAQFELLRNLSGRELSFADNAPTQDNFTRDVVRGFRAMRSDADPTNNDPNNGFLRDVEPPRVVGVQDISIQSKSAIPGLPDGNFLVDFRFGSVPCQQTPVVGSVIFVVSSGSDVFASVTEQATPPVNGQVSSVKVRVLGNPDSPTYPQLVQGFVSATDGEFLSIFEPGPGVIPECFVKVTPAPLSPPAARLDPESAFSVRFTESLDPASITAHDNFRVNRGAGEDPPTPDRLVVGNVVPGVDYRRFTFESIVPLDHEQNPGGVPAPEDQYFVNLIGGLEGVTDLAGNALVDPLPADLMFTVDPGAPGLLTGGVVLRFSQIDEDGVLNGEGNPTPEVRGQLRFDTARGVLLPREVTRRSQVVDTTQPLQTVMQTLFFDPPLPINPLGARAMTVWRYADLGLLVLDESTSNVDVEGLSFSPLNGSAASDFTSGFEIALSHSTKLPDEFPLPVAAALLPTSGLETTFAANVLDDDENELTVVHPRSRGYLVDPSATFTSSTGTVMAPLPLNRGIPIEQFRRYTWRDTALTAVGGSGGFGADIAALNIVGLLCNTFAPSVYDAGQVRSLALPLLIDMKCFPDNTAVGLNFMVGSSTIPFSADLRPFFSLITAGGFSANGSPVSVNPDASVTAEGFPFPADVIDPVTGGVIATQGSQAPGAWNFQPHGQVDLVSRISRVHTIWFDTGILSASGADFFEPVVEPSPDELPVGTRIELAFRGAIDVLGTDVPDGAAYDPYGDPLETRTLTGPACDGDMNDGITIVNADITPQFLDADPTWKANIDDIDGARFFQVRITFVSNAATMLLPELSTLAVAFQERGAGATRRPARPPGPAARSGRRAPTSESARPDPSGFARRLPRRLGRRRAARPRGAAAK